MSKKSVVYVEPEDYFPKDIREKFFPESNVDSDVDNNKTEINEGEKPEKSNEKNDINEKN